MLDPVIPIVRDFISDENAFRSVVTFCFKVFCIASLKERLKF